MLSAIRDPAAAIKLFGKTIPVLSSGGFQVSLVPVEEDVGGRLTKISRMSPDRERTICRKESEEEEDQEADKENEGDSSMAADDPISPPGKPATENHDATSDNHVEINSKSLVDGETNDSHGQGQPLIKKPDKILPCPRCDSMDTKFCYYNNYNVNQPRHFCKSCQRYWTAGGAMRNVPVGSGRRKNKTSTCASHQCQMSVDQGDGANVGAYHHPAAFNTSSVGNMVIAFGSENKFPVPVPDRSSGSTASTTCSSDEAVKKPTQETTTPPLNGFSTSTSTPIPCCFPTINWPPNYPWNAAAVPLPFYPPWYWPYAWTLPVVAPPPPQNGLSCTPALGKHAREEPEGNARISPRDHHMDGNIGAPPVLVPKTLRIDDPDEAVKSSIWTALGIDEGKIDRVGEGGLISRGTRLKSGVKALKSGNCQVLKANPAALCRSIKFQENAF